jgi:hypothetical protein
MNEAAVQTADFESHHIEGFAHAAGGMHFKVPLITPVDDLLWQGGCKNGVNLGGKFAHIISLYPWEQYNPGADLESALFVTLFDAGEIPDPGRLYAVARYVNECRKTGRTLVHCQAGLNRSGLIAGLALVLEGMAPADAIAKLRASRSPAVLCNKVFENWLLDQAPERLAA